MISIYFSAFLFCIGIYLVLTRKNAIAILIGVELMLNAANINFVAFSPPGVGLIETGKDFALFIIVIAAAQSAVALAIVLNVYRKFGTTSAERSSE